MTAVFRHGALRLYLLRLLDEHPRHGYEVISLLEDRFLGLYAPSAGTVYPRLAKLETEGLVELIVIGFILDQRGACQEIEIIQREIIQRRRDDLFLQGFQQDQEFPDRDW